MLRIPNDDYVHVSFRVADLKKHPPSLPVVYLFGGSATMELMRSEGALSDAVTAAAGTPVEVVDLAAHDQSPGQTLAILDNLPAGRGLLAVGVSPNRLTASPQTDARQLEGRPLALTSPHLAGVLAGRVEVSRRLPGLLPGILDFAVSYVRSRASLSSPWLTSVARADHYYADDQIADMSARIAGSREELARERQLYDRYATYNLDVLRGDRPSRSRTRLHRRALRAAAGARGQRVRLAGVPGALPGEHPRAGKPRRRRVHRRPAPGASAGRRLRRLLPPAGTRARQVDGGLRPEPGEGLGAGPGYRLTAVSGAFGRRVCLLPASRVA